MIRHYETIGLVPAPARRDSNYRDYDADDVHRLGFVRRARDLGFSIEEIRDLLRLWGDKDRASADVRALAAAHVADLDTRIERLREMRATLAQAGLRLRRRRPTPLPDHRISGRQLRDVPLKTLETF